MVVGGGRGQVALSSHSWAVRGVDMDITLANHLVGWVYWYGGLGEFVESFRAARHLVAVSILTVLASLVVLFHGAL